jgi:predicted dehydrogenase
MTNIAIIGCGLVGVKRSKQLASFNLVAVHDIDPTRSAAISESTGAKIFGDWKDIINNPGVDAVIVATRHDMLAPISLAAIRAGKHVLVEKPAAMNIEQIKEMITAAEEHNVLVRVGFNHRYHPSIIKAREMIDEGSIGDITYIRSQYGHGGRIGYDREWRADPALAAGGELVEQGIHTIDLAHYFLGAFEEIGGYAGTYFWNQELDDNAFVMLKTIDNRIASLHVSCTQWKNTFSFEIGGTKGKIEINGLGGSYGTERLTYYRVRPEMGPPDTTIWEYPQEDRSWETEMYEFECDISKNRIPAANLESARKCWNVINKIYEQSK